MWWGRGYRARSRGCGKRCKGRGEDRRREKDLGIVMGRSGLVKACSTVSVQISCVGSVLQSLSLAKIYIS